MTFVFEIQHDIEWTLVKIVIASSIIDFVGSFFMKKKKNPNNQLVFVFKTVHFSESKSFTGILNI